MVWTDPGSAARERGLPFMYASGIEHLDVIRLIEQYPADIAAAEKTRWATLGSVDELWRVEAEEIDTFAPLILSQIEARGRGIHWSLFRLLRAVRLGNTAAVPVILSTVPKELRSAAVSILHVEPRSMHEAEIPIIFTLNELRLTRAIAEREHLRIAGAPPAGTYEEARSPSDAPRLWAVVVDELLGEQIDFPLPATIRDVLRLRDRPETADFRRFLEPFVDSVARGDHSEFASLRREVRACVKAFRRLPTTRRLAKWAAYASIGIGVAEAFAGFAGPSVATGLLGLGLERLAARLNARSSWLYLAHH